MRARQRWARDLSVLGLLLGLALHLLLGLGVIGLFAMGEASTLQQQANLKRVATIAGWSWLPVLAIIVVLVLQS